VNVGAKEARAQGDTLTVDDKMTLGTKLALIGPILARLIPLFTGAGTVILSIDCHRHYNALEVVILPQVEPPELGEDPGGRPLLEVLVGSQARLVLAGQHPPLTTGTQPVHDAVRDRAVWRRQASSSG
jgi:hypothetical protein